jgi:glycosyltransferase involved in cell wall biosynthesis
VRILLVTDAWYPQVNGVVRTLDTLRKRLIAAGDEVRYLTPDGFVSMPCPTYPEIRLALAGPGSVRKIVAAFRPDAIHIATEGPLGLAARLYCARAGLPFTTAFHTRFPEYVHARFRVPVRWTYALLRWFHGPSRAIMTPTKTVLDDLVARGFPNVRLWTRGVDTDLFRPGAPEPIDGPGPVLMYVGRIAVEKNIQAFLDLDVPGAKVVVGDGPMIDQLRRRHPDVRFVGVKHGEELTRYYNAADVFVFPSKTDTFGLVMLEALACGTPVAAYPVMGPKDVITDPRAGRLDNDLKAAVEAALALNRDDCRAFAETFSWEECARLFRGYLAPFDPSLLPAATASQPPQQGEPVADRNQT